MDTQNNNKRKALGRGLEELFNNETIDYSKLEEKIYEQTSSEEVIEVQLDELRSNPYQPRKTFNEASLNELAASIKEHGVFQPIIVKKSIKGYDIIAGERRVKASKMVGLKTIPAIVRNFTDDQMMEIALLENLQREDLNSIDEANAYSSLLKNLNITQEELAQRLGKSRSHITNMLGLLSLPDEVKSLIISGKISMGHARVLSKLEDLDKINDLANKIVTEQLSVRDVENLAEGQQYVRRNKIKKEYSREYAYLENNISETLGTRVKISSKKIEISFENVNDLNRILDILKLNR